MSRETNQNDYIVLHDPGVGKAQDNNSSVGLLDGIIKRQINMRNNFRSEQQRDAFALDFMEPQRRTDFFTDRKSNARPQTFLERIESQKSKPVAAAPVPSQTSYINQSLLSSSSPRNMTSQIYRAQSTTSLASQHLEQQALAKANREKMLVVSRNEEIKRKMDQLNREKIVAEHAKKRRREHQIERENGEREKILREMRRQKEKRERKEKAKMLRDKGEREKMLMKDWSFELGEDYRFTMSADVIKMRKNVSHLLDTLMSASYMSSINTIIPPKIPEYFESAKEYSKAIIPGYMEECKAKIEQEMIGFTKDPWMIDRIRCKLEYIQHESDRFCVFRLVEQEGNPHFAYRKNMLVLLSNQQEPNIECINTDSKKFCLVGMLMDKERKDDQKLMISTICEKYAIQAAKKKEAINVFELTKITSEIREYLGIINLEFDPISRFVFQPKKIASDCSIKHHKSEFASIFNVISPKFNKGQFKAISNICRTKEGIQLLQGPVIYEVTLARHRENAYVVRYCFWHLRLYPIQ